MEKTYRGFAFIKSIDHVHDDELLKLYWVIFKGQNINIETASSTPKRRLGPHHQPPQ